MVLNLIKSILNLSNKNQLVLVKIFKQIHLIILKIIQKQFAGIATVSTQNKKPRLKKFSIYRWVYIIF